MFPEYLFEKEAYEAVEMREALLEAIFALTAIKDNLKYLLDGTNAGVVSVFDCRAKEALDKIEALLSKKEPMDNVLDRSIVDASINNLHIKKDPSVNQAMVEFEEILEAEWELLDSQLAIIYLQLAGDLKTPVSLKKVSEDKSHSWIYRVAAFGIALYEYEKTARARGSEAPIISLSETFNTLRYVDEAIVDKIAHRYLDKWWSKFLAFAQSHEEKMRDADADKKFSQMKKKSSKQHTA